LDIKNRRILITAGPTWAPIDSVRVISNIATGKTGILLAQNLQRLGAKVTLVLGPAGDCSLNKKIKLIRFRFFDELKQIIRKELRAKEYDIVIHSAAVSDFKAARAIKGKLVSGRTHNLKLITLPKISSDIRRYAPEARLILFKLESGIPDSELIKRSREMLKRQGANLAVANRAEPFYRAFITGEDNIYAQVDSKEGLAEGLVSLLR